MRRITIHTQKVTRGFTLLFSILAASLLLAASLAIFNIAMKESVLSSAATDSQIAFYAADTGIECALYWDLQEDPPGSSFGATPSSITCNMETISTGSQVVPTSPPRASVIGGALQSIFFLDFSPNQTCAIITVDKSAPPTTVVESRGFNTCDSASARRVERAIRVVF